MRRFTRAFDARSVVTRLPRYRAGARVLRRARLKSYYHQLTLERTGAQDGDCGEYA